MRMTSDHRSRTEMAFLLKEFRSDGCYLQAVDADVPACRSPRYKPRRIPNKGQIPLRYPGRRQVRGWSQTYSDLEFGLSSSSLAASELARASRSATSLGPVCDQDSVA